MIKYKRGLLYLLTFMISLIAFYFVMELWNRDLTIPFVYVEDGLGPLLEIKTLADGGDVYHYNYYNAPFNETELYGVKGYNLYLIVFKIFLIFTDSIGLVENIFYILTFPLTAVTMLMVLKKINVKDEIALIGSILYSFLPYHFLRNEMHLFFATYIFIPLVSYAIILLYNDNVYDGDLLTFRELNKSIFRKDKFIAIAGCFLLGASDIYNSFFAAIIIGFAGVVSTIKYKKKRNLYYMFVLLMALIIPILVNVMPALIYSANSDIGHFASNRGLNDIDRYGLRISQMLMPITDHRLSFLADLREQFDNAGFSNLLESNMNSLGLFMSLGLVIGLIVLFFTKWQDDIVSSAAQINVFIILLSGIGGFNIFVAMFFTYYIRAYCRIIVFIAVFSNIITCICLSKLVEYSGEKPFKIMKKIHIGGIICIALLILGVLDQTSTSYASSTDFDYVKSWDSTLDELDMKWNNDKKFISEIEKICSEDAMIFEMPILSYAEMENNVFRNGLPHTDRFMRPYLHSKTLYWSYPYVNGANSYASLWNVTIDSLSVRKKMEAVTFAGFEGVYVDTYSLSEKQAKLLIKQLSNILSDEPIVSDDGELFFFSLKNFTEEMKADYTEASWNERKLYWLYEYRPKEIKSEIQTDSLYFLGDTSENKDKVALFPGTLQYGPYYYLEKGIYDICISGENFDTDCYVKCTTDLGETEIEIMDLVISDNEITYRVIIEEDMFNIEFLLKNSTDKKVFIDSISYTKTYMEKEYVIHNENNIVYFCDEDTDSLDLIPGKYIFEILGDNLENVEFRFEGIDENDKKVSVSGRKLYSDAETVCIYLNIDSRINISNLTLVSKEGKPSYVDIVKVFSK